RGERGGAVLSPEEEIFFPSRPKGMPTALHPSERLPLTNKPLSLVLFIKKPMQHDLK
ncbi:MAG: hypothetical protein ACI9EW_001391, partial [Cellvibrionaceae bacterium]